jgi:LmbE family N-acetylglucosaminyl deacetylase
VTPPPQPEQSDQLHPMPTEFDRALAIVAHPDDLEYGASSAVAVWTDAGKTVTYLLVTRGEAGIDGIDPAECGPLRQAEQIEAAHCVGVDVVEFLGHRDGVIEHSLALRSDIAAAIRRHRPELVITLNHHDTWFGQHWNSPDHRNTGRAVLDAVGDAGNRWIFPEQLVDGTQPWSGVKWVAVAGSANATHAVDIESGLERAIASLEAHRTYLAGLGGDMADARAFLTNSAQAGAPRFGGRLCTTFELIGEPVAD